jgi:hypothetical protein
LLFHASIASRPADSAKSTAQNAPGIAPTMSGDDAAGNLQWTNELGTDGSDISGKTGIEATEPAAMGTRFAIQVAVGVLTLVFEVQTPEMCEFAHRVSCGVSAQEEI